MKEFIIKIWNWFVGLLNKIRRSRIYSFIAGIIIAAFFAIVLSMSFCVWPVFFVGFGKEFIDLWLDKDFNWIDLAATVAGGLIIQLFVII